MSALLPRDPALDATRAFFREGYDYVGNRCRALGSDMFRARIMLRRVTVMMGAEAAARFYDGESFTRRGAMPQTTMRLLQDKNSVQSLDGAAHARRKALFLAMMTGDPVEEMADHLEHHWQAALPDWQARDRVTLHDAVARVLCAAACDWAGVSLTGDALDRRTEEMTAMINGAGSVGPRSWRGLLLRQRAERWARRCIVAAREEGGEDTPVRRLALFRDEQGQLLDLKTAGVELLNIVRPIVAVARFITFAALALHEHETARAAVARGDVDAFAQEVRRFYPFFPVIAGRVIRPFRWHDHDFAEGEWVMLGLHATNHDPRLWPEPERFDPARFDGAAPDVVAQGAGEHRRDHRCPGEWITLALICRATRLLTKMRYTVPAQDLSVPLNRFPTLPNSGFVIASR